MADRDEHVTWQRRQRRVLLLGAGASWTVAACGSLRPLSALPVDAEAASPMGARGATHGGGGRATLVREIDFERPQHAANHMAWSADGNRLALGGSLDLRIGVVDVHTGNPLPPPGEQLAGVHALAYSPDGRYLAVVRAGTGRRADPAAPRYTVSLWDAQTSAPAGYVIEPEGRGIDSIQAHALAFSSSGEYLAVAYARQTAIYALRDGHGVQRVRALPPAARCAFRPGAALLATLSFGLRGRTVVLYQIPDGHPVATIEVQGTNLAWSADGRLLAIANGAQIGVHDLAGRQPVTTLSVSDPDASFHSASFSSDGRWFAAAAGRRVDLWEVASWAHVTTLDHKKRFIASAAFSPRGTPLAVAGEAPVTIWDVR
jgi:WD40 repeat protein